MPPNALKEADITIGQNPLYLKSAAPTIYHDYVSHEEAYATVSISPEISRLMSNPAFTRAVEDKLGSFDIVELQVEPNKDVFVKRPGTERYEQINVPQSRDIDTELVQIIRKTQDAYKLFLGSQPTTPESSPPLSPRRVSSNPGKLSPGYEDLRRQVSDLQRELLTVRLKQDLDPKKRQVQQLLRHVLELEDRNADANAILDEARSLFEEDGVFDLVAAIRDLQQRLHQQTLTNAELRQALQALARQKQDEVGALQDELDAANRLFDSDTRPLPAKIRSLMQKAADLAPLQHEVERLQQIIREIQQTVPGEDHQLPPLIAQLKEAHDALQARLLQSEDQVAALRQEIHRLREQHGADEHQIKEVTALVQTLRERNGELEEHLSQTRAALQLLQREHEAIASKLPHDPSGRSLPERVGALVSALDEEQETNVALRRQIHELTDEVAKLRAAQNELADTNQRLERDLLEKTQELQELQAAKDLSDARVLELQEAFRDQKAQFEERIRGLEHQLLQTGDANTALRQELQETQAQRAALSREALETQRTIERLEEINRGHVHAIDELTQAQQDLCLLLGIQAPANIPEKVADLLLELEETKKQRALLSHHALETQETIDRYERDLLEKTQELQELQAAKDLSDARVLELQEAFRDQKAQFEERIRGLEHQLLQTGDANTALRQELQETQAQRAALSREALETQRIIDRLEEINRGHVHAIAELTQAQRDLCLLLGIQDPVNIPEKVAELLLELEETKQKCALLSHHALETQETIDRYERALDEMRAQVGTLTSELQDLHTLFDLGDTRSLREKILELQMTLEETQKKYAACSSYILETAHETQELQESLEGEREKNTALRRQIHELTAEVEELRTAQDEVAAIFQPKDAQHDHSAPRSSPISSRVQELADTNQRLERDLLEKALELQELQTAQELSDARVLELQEALRDQKAQFEERIRGLEHQLQQEKESTAAQLAILQGIQSGLPVHVEPGALPAHIKTLVARNEALTARLEEAGHDRESLEVQLRDIRAEAATLREQISAESDAKAALQYTLGQIKSQLGSPQADNGELVGLIATLQDQLREARELASSTRDLLVEEQDKNARLEEALATQRSTLRDQISRAEEELSQLRPLTTEVEELRATLLGVQRSLGSGGDLPVQVAQLKQAYEKLQVADQGNLQSIESLQKELQALSLQKAASDRRVDELTLQLQHEREQNKLALSQAQQRLEETTRAAEDTRLDLQGKLDRAEEELRDLRPLPQEVATLQKALQNVRTALSVGLDANLQVQAEALKQKFDRLSQENPELQAINKRLQSELSTATARIEELSLAQETATKEIEQLRAQNRDLGLENTTLRDRLAAFQREQDEIAVHLPGDQSGATLPLRVGNFAEALESLRKELDQEKRSTASLEDRVRGMDQAQRQKETAIDQLRVDLRQAEERGSDSQEEAARLKAILEDFQARLGPCHRLDVQMGQVPEFAHLPDQLADRLEQIKAAEDQFALTETKMRALRLEMTQLHEDYAHKLEELSGSVESERERLQKEFDEAQAQLDAALVKARKDFDERREDLRVTLASVREELANMTEDRDELAAEIGELEKRNKVLERSVRQEAEKTGEVQSILDDTNAELREEQQYVLRLRREIGALKQEQINLQKALEDKDEKREELGDLFALEKAKLDVRNEALQRGINSLRIELLEAQERIRELETENHTLRKLIAKMLGLPIDSHMPSTEELEEAARVFAFRYGSTTQVIEERDLARSKIEQMSQALQKTEAALLEVSGNAYEEQLALENEVLRQQQLREEQERAHQDAIAHLELLAHSAAEENAIEDVLELQAEDPSQAQVLHAEEGLQAIVQAMRHGVHLPKLSYKQQEVIGANMKALLGGDKVSVESIFKMLSSKYNNKIKPAAALLVMFDRDADKIQLFCRGIERILSRKVLLEETRLGLAGQTQFQALQNLQRFLRASNEKILELHRRHNEANDLTAVDYEEIERLCTVIPMARQEITQITEGFIPTLLDALVDSGSRCFPYIIRELHGWINFFDALDAGHFKVMGEIIIAGDTKVERFRQAITRLNRTLETFFRLFDPPNTE